MRRCLLSIPVFVLVFAVSSSVVLAPGSPRVAQAPQASLVTAEVDRSGFVKGAYISYAALGSTDFVDHVQQLLETTELNAIVMDFKGDYGLLTFPTEVPLAQNIGADRAVMQRDPAEFLRWFKDRGVYTIARIVAFKDNVLAEGVPDWAVTDAATGGVWRDREGMGWVDPFVQGAWTYNAALAVEAATMGFDEVQFDYMRFPTDGNMGRALYSQASTQDSRVGAIAGLLRTTKEALQPYRVKLGADVFGYTVWVEDDLGIGQHIESLAPYLDVLAPMSYPSTYSHGLPGEDPAFQDAIAYPYEVVHLTAVRAVTRLHSVNPDAQVRPWIQDFQDYAFDGRVYTPAEIRRQMDGARHAGSRGWMLWDPAVRYTRSGLVSAHPSYRPNPRGKVPVLAYGAFDATNAAQPDASARTPEAFRGDLERLLEAGFYPINLRDLASGDLTAVPAGKRPVVLTFDGSTADQFRLLPGGSVDPSCAVGVLASFNAAHFADWPLRGTFFVRQEGEQPSQTLFGTADLALAKLQLLVSWGMEIGVYADSASSSTSRAPTDVASAIGRAKIALESWLPGYQVASFALSEGNLPAASISQGEVDGIPYSYQAAVLSGGGAASAPLMPGFDPFRIPRIRVTDDAFAKVIDEAGREGTYYVSAGE